MKKGKSSRKSLIIGANQKRKIRDQKPTKKKESEPKPPEVTNVLEQSQSNLNLLDPSNYIDRFEVQVLADDYEVEVLLLNQEVQIAKDSQLIEMEVDNNNFAGQQASDFVLDPLEMAKLPQLMKSLHQLQIPMTEQPAQDLFSKEELDFSSMTELIEIFNINQSYYCVIKTKNCSILQKVAYELVQMRRPDLVCDYLNAKYPRK